MAEFLTTEILDVKTDEALKFKGSGRSLTCVNEEHWLHIRVML